MPDGGGSAHAGARHRDRAGAFGLATTDDRQEPTIPSTSSEFIPRALGAALGLLALYLAAHAIMSALAWRLLTGAEPTDEAASPVPWLSSWAERGDDSGQALASAAERQRREHMRTQLSGHNPFCPTCIDLPSVDEGPTEPPPPGVTLLQPGERETELPLDLVATMEALPPGRSFATIAHQGKAGLFGEGDEVFDDVLDDVELLLVEGGVVHLQVEDEVEFLRLSSAERSKRPKPGDRPSRPSLEPRRKSRYELPGARDAIACKGTDCTIERRFVDQLLANPAQLTRQGRAIPYDRDGLRGFRLSRVLRGTIPRLLGLRSGDVVTSINGQPLATLDAAMRLLPRLRHASHLTVEVVRNRRGQRQPLRLEVDIL